MIRTIATLLTMAVLGLATASGTAQAGVPCRVCADDKDGLANNCCAYDCTTKPSCNSCCNKKKKLALAHKTKGGSGLAGKMTIEAAYNVCSTDCLTKLS